MPNSLDGLIRGRRRGIALIGGKAHSSHHIWMDRWTDERTEGPRDRGTELPYLMIWEMRLGGLCLLGGQYREKKRGILGKLSKLTENKIEERIEYGPTFYVELLFIVCGKNSWTSTMRSKVNSTIRRMMKQRHNRNSVILVSVDALRGPAYGLPQGVGKTWAQP
jgi:hypothetical protein